MANIKKISKAKNLSAGPSKKTKNAGPVDPKGQYTKVQERTLGNMKKGGKMKKAEDGIDQPRASKKERVLSADKRTVTIRKERSTPSGVMKKEIKRPTVYGRIANAADKVGDYLSKKLDVNKNGGKTYKKKK
jgi:hypothetical protein